MLPFTLMNSILKGKAISCYKDGKIKMHILPDLYQDKTLSWLL